MSNGATPADMRNVRHAHSGKRTSPSVPGTGKARRWPAAWWRSPSASLEPVSTPGQPTQLTTSGSLRANATPISARSQRSGDRRAKRLRYGRQSGSPECLPLPRRNGRSAWRWRPPNSRSCRIKRVACSHAYPLIGMFTPKIESRLEAVTSINSASSFVSPATSRWCLVTCLGWPGASVPGERGSHLIRGASG